MAAAGPGKDSSPECFFVTSIWHIWGFRGRFPGVLFLLLTAASKPITRIILTSNQPVQRCQFLAGRAGFQLPGVFVFRFVCSGLPGDRIVELSWVGRRQLAARLAWRLVGCSGGCAAVWIWAGPRRGWIPATPRCARNQSSGPSRTHPSSHGRHGPHRGCGRGEGGGRG